MTVDQLLVAKLAHHPHRLSLIAYLQKLNRLEHQTDPQQQQLNEQMMYQALHPLTIKPALVHAMSKLQC